MQQFEKFAKDNGLTITARHVANRSDRDIADQWNESADHFQVTLSKSDLVGSSPDSVVWVGYYSTGGAHSLTWARAGKGTNRPYNLMRSLRIVKDLPYNTGRMTMDQKSAFEHIRHVYQKTAPIFTADILLALQCDSSGWLDTFEDWAENYGYSSDSIKARKTFDACQDTAKCLLRALGSEKFDLYLNLEEE